MHFTTSIELAGDCAITLLLLLVFSPPLSLFFPFCLFWCFLSWLGISGLCNFLWVLVYMCCVSESLRFASSLDKTLFLYVFVGEERECERE